MKLAILFLLAALPALAQTNNIAPAPPANVTNSLIEKAESQTNSLKDIYEHGEKVRAACIQGRRLICGKILEVLPDGLVVESGYTNLVREPLTRSWLAPGTVTASLTPN